ncbi:MAG: rod shape-determining protein MreC [Flavobacteriaceae bacterium]|nr:rod shape-determining protein MreC [Flavobacteriaceae bacterium]
MRNLLIFLQRYYIFILFITLESIGFSMLVSHNNIQQATMVNASNALVGKFYESVSGLTDYFKLGQVNDQLQQENAMYRMGQLSSFYDNGAVKIVRVDSNLGQQFTYMAAKVLNNSVTMRNNYLTLNRGSIHGVKKQMGVVSPSGLVGVVMNVSPHYCTVLSMLNKNSHISAKIIENNYFGSLEWNGDDPRNATLKDINKHVEVKLGQTVVTSSYSTVFPEGIPIGKIQKVGFDPGGNFYELKVKLSTDFSSLSSVYIITNLMKDEIDLLEEKTKGLGEKIPSANNPTPAKP